MYTFSYYTEQDQQKVIAFMQANPFAVITGAGETYPVATHIPLEITVRDGKIFLSGHIMRKTDHHLAFEKNTNVLVIFNGPHCYVSASWYTNPQVGSTWNYMSVHAKGTISFTGEEGAYEAVRTVTNRYEGAGRPGSFDNIPEEYKQRMVKAIVGFEIEVQSLESVFKLSQEKDEATKKNIIEQLKKREDDNSVMIAEEMEHRLL